MKLILKLNDMSFTRADAIDKCNSLGKLFTENFEKIFNEPKAQSVNHWCDEMQGWLDDIRNITLKQNKKPLPYTYIMDWFFTRGSSPDQFFKDENLVDSYEEFLSKISKYDFNVRETIKNIFNL